MSSKYNKYGTSNSFSSVVFERWTVLVPILCYLVLFSAIWILSIPLRPTSDSATIVEGNKYQSFEDAFEIKMKNSNFANSDNNENGEGKISDKNEYLVNTNNEENVHKNQADILQDVFRKADRDHNGKLDSKELAQWIRMKIVEHISTAISNNYGLFSMIDLDPKNNVITWKEYHTYFLKKRGFSTKYVRTHDEKRHRGLQRAIKEQIMRDKASWMEAAKTNPDSLTVEEFLTFTHPESSAANQLALVDELYDKFDRDGDELLTEDEFAVLQTEGGTGEDEAAPVVVVVVRQDENERRAEFRKSIDLNGDGKADRRELLHYVAPQSPRHSEHEAEALLALADTDHDNTLSLDEIMAHPNLFLKSKMVDTGRSFHDEF